MTVNRLPINPDSSDYYHFLVREDLERDSVLRTLLEHAVGKNSVSRAMRVFKLMQLWDVPTAEHREAIRETVRAILKQWEARGL